MILALTTYTANGYELYWAFDSVDQYTLACWHLNRHCVEWNAHHIIDRHNKPHAVVPELDWEELSDGLNDADDVERWIYMSHLNKTNAKPMNPDYALEGNQ